MGYLIEISDNKLDKMSEYVEEMLWAGGELMHCLEKVKGKSGYGERESYGSRYGERGGQGSRGGYGSRYDEMSERGRYGSRGGSMGYRDEEEWDEEESMGERRGVRGSGRGRR